MLEVLRHTEGRVIFTVTHLEGIINTVNVDIFVLYILLRYSPI